MKSLFFGRSPARKRAKSWKSWKSFFWRVGANLGNLGESWKYFPTSRKLNSEVTIHRSLVTIHWSLVSGLWSLFTIH